MISINDRLIELADPGEFAKFCADPVTSCADLRPEAKAAILSRDRDLVFRLAQTELIHQHGMPTTKKCGNGTEAIAKDEHVEFQMPVRSSHGESARLGSLVIGGAGLRAITQVTTETRRWLEVADKVFYLLSDPVSEAWIHGLNATAECLCPFYGDGKERSLTYSQMSRRIISFVERGLNVCAIFYGHPTVGSTPVRQAVEESRRRGNPTKILPAVSSFDCLCADLGFDPFVGCEMYEASDCLWNERKLHSDTPLVLWQIGYVGSTVYRGVGHSLEHLPAFIQYLEQFYPPNHDVVVYEASPHPLFSDRIFRTAIDDLMDADLSLESTIFIPPRV